MALVIEDGTNVSGANSFVTLVEARSYAAARSLSLPTDDAALEALLLNAVDYLESKRQLYQGQRASVTQSLQWPRVDVFIDDVYLAATVIPDLLKSAQIRLAAIAYSGVDLMPTRSGPIVKKEKVGPIETEYSETVGTTIEPSMTVIDYLLAPLLKSKMSQFFLKTVRV
jgi:hypothetical protein